MRLRAPRSLAGQFALLHVGVALVAAVVLAFGTGALLHHAARHYQREVLRRQARGVAVAMRTRPAAEALGEVDILAGGLTLSVVDRRRRVEAQRGPQRPEILATIPLVRVGRLYRRGPLAAVSLPVGDRWIVVAQDDAAPEVVTDDIVRAFLKRFALLLLPVAMLAPLAGAWLTRRLTRRMSRASGIAAAIGPDTLDRRLPRGTLPMEVEPLAVATNAALDRLEQAFARQAAFAADVAHELRTPLAVIRVRADTVGDAALRDTLVAQVDRAARVIGQLMELAGLERPFADAGEAVDLSALARGVVAQRAPAILEGGRTIMLDDRHPHSIAAHPGALLLALDNLVDNAMRHTPPGTTIVVTAGPGPRIAVCDDGPVVPAAQFEHMATRFWRRPDTIVEGSGLGLSIVTRVVEAHHGRLDVAPGPGGRGVQVVMTFVDAAPGVPQH
ncbi:hypothetical protein LPN01_00010 [Sphingomonas sp. A2-49]|uniref:sensor histidine kinase n=1 Tax=Sphingomonas sp. A2-49 TaxID=1391375 RepID=UPI0021D3BED2|nr:ATP-binding protein [Sphingomonas sp. A2-49]MCU6452457.1 hypothetical protein [Sphingomonas sp. A2-49]